MIDNDRAYQVNIDSIKLSLISNKKPTQSHDN